jgi:hypothetical protein
MPWITVFGIPAMVYVMSITALLFYVNDKPQNPLLLVGAGLLTSAIYMFHRTSIRAIEPMQARHRIAVCHKTKLRFISGIVLLISAAAFAAHHPLTALLVFCSVVGVIVYGREIVTKPLRNFLYLKPLAVGIAITLFAWALNDFSNSIVTLVAFILICSGDALLCDFEDCAYDSASGCSTLATKLGFLGTWVVVGILYIVAATSLQTSIGWLFLVLFPIPLLAQKWVRSLVDIRPLLVLLLAWSL